MHDRRDISRSGWNDLVVRGLLVSKAGIRARSLFRCRATEVIDFHRIILEFKKSEKIQVHYRWFPEELWNLLIRRYERIENGSRNDFDFVLQTGESE